jgi:hypothetical protein
MAELLYQEAPVERNACAAGLDHMRNSCCACRRAKRSVSTSKILGRLEKACQRKLSTQSFAVRIQGLLESPTLEVSAEAISAITTNTQEILRSFVGGGHINFLLYFAPHPFWGKAVRLMIGRVSGIVHGCSERCK